MIPWYLYFLQKQLITKSPVKDVKNIKDVISPKNTDSM